MPTTPPTRCSYPGCHTLTPTGGRCPTHTPTPWAQRSRHQPAGTSRRRRRIKAQVFRRDHGHCHLCGQPGATELDHITPLHLGGAEWDSNNMAPAHSSCHAHKSQTETAAANHKRTQARQARNEPT